MSSNKHANPKGNDCTSQQLILSAHRNTPCTKICRGYAIVFYGFLQLSRTACKIGIQVVEPYPPFSTVIINAYGYRSS